MIFLNKSLLFWNKRKTLKSYTYVATTTTATAAAAGV